MWMLELLPALGRTNLYFTENGFYWDFLRVCLGFSPGFLHTTTNFPTTISCSKIPPVAPQINWDYLTGFYALLRGETLLSLGAADPKLE